MESGRWSRVSWICLLLVSGGACFPASEDFRLPYKPAGGAASYNPRAGLSPRVASSPGSGIPWEYPSAEGAASSFWASPAEAPQGEPRPLRPSTFIVQSRNGYQRVLEVSSQTRYSPEYPNPPKTRASKGVRG